MDDYWSKIIDAGWERYKERHAALQKALGEPAVFIADETDPRFGIGYWKSEGGVIAYRRYANGYSAKSRMEYDNSLIDILVKVRGMT